jgi:hypothetical protein
VTFKLAILSSSVLLVYKIVLNIYIKQTDVQLQLACKQVECRQNATSISGAAVSVDLMQSLGSPVARSIVRIMIVCRSF